MGDRVALNRDMKDTEGGDVKANEIGVVYAHMGDRPLVEMNHGESYTGGKRLVVCEPGDIRRAIVASPGSARRSKPRRDR